jgi:hypothetical protein
LRIETTMATMYAFQKVFEDQDQNAQTKRSTR